MNRRCFIQMSYYLLVCLFLTISAASARVCFLPDSTDCGSSDVDIPDVPCKYYTCKEAGLKNEAYQTCYDERTFNKGGTLVPCKQVKCKLSKSECEAQEANANNPQCCNFDDKSGCYYMGGCPKQCDRNIFDSEKDLGEDYNCTSCKDKNGTFYNCTPKDKECSDINSNYSTSCSDSQIAKEVTGVKDSHGNQCYTCESKPTDKCVNIAATKDTKIVPFTTMKATENVEETAAKLVCGEGGTKVGKSYSGAASSTNSLVVHQLQNREYSLYSDGNYYLKETDSTTNVSTCRSNKLCSQYAAEGAYISDITISGYINGKLINETYCCNLDWEIPQNTYKDNVLYTDITKSCKHPGSGTLLQHDPYYVCENGGTLVGNKCRKVTYSCPAGSGFALNGDTCVKPVCPDGYSINGFQGSENVICAAKEYSCPTDGKYKYKLSGNQCVCDNDPTCKEINSSYLTMVDTGADACRDFCKTKGKAPIYRDTGSDGTCVTCEQTEIIITLEDETNYGLSSPHLEFNQAGEQELVTGWTSKYLGFTVDTKNGYNEAEGGMCGYKENEYNTSLQIWGSDHHSYGTRYSYGFSSEPNDGLDHVYYPITVTSEDENTSPIYSLYYDCPNNGGGGTVSNMYCETKPSNLKVYVEGKEVLDAALNEVTGYNFFKSLNGKTFGPDNNNPYVVKFNYEYYSNQPDANNPKDDKKADISVVFYEEDKDGWPGDYCEDGLLKKGESFEGEECVPLLDNDICYSRYDKHCDEKCIKNHSGEVQLSYGSSDDTSLPFDVEIRYEYYRPVVKTYMKNGYDQTKDFCMRDVEPWGVSEWILSSGSLTLPKGSESNSYVSTPILDYAPSDVVSGYNDFASKTYKKVLTGTIDDSAFKSFSYYVKGQKIEMGTSMVIDGVKYTFNRPNI